MNDIGRFLFWATLGNTFGGVFFVALIKHGHAPDQGQGGKIERSLIIMGENLKPPAQALQATGR